MAGVTLYWTGHDGLSPDLKRALVGPGAPFELERAHIGDRDVDAFARRARNMADHFRSGVGQHADRPYLVFPEQTLNYGEVAGSVRRIARELADGHGVRPGDRVAIASANVLEHVLSVWSLFSIGAIVVELNAWWTPAELGRAVELTTPTLALTDDKRRALVVQADPDLPIVTWGQLSAAAAHRSDDALPAVSIAEADPAAVLFTSGTTGAARGVTLSHANLISFSYMSALSGAVNRFKSDQPPSRGQHAAFAVSPLFHVSGFAPTFSNALMFGSKLVFPGPGGYDERKQLLLTEEHQITSWSGVPTIFQRLLNAPYFAAYDTSSVSTVGVGGSNVSPDLLELIHRKLPGATVTNGYGMTESTGMGTLLYGEDLVGHADSVGRVMPTVEAQIRDESGSALPEGSVGEVCLRGAGLFAGYWADPQATAAAIVADGWYRTGDFGVIVGGLLQLRSRMRDLILRGGENVYPMEIENCLSGHPAIEQVAVVGLPDPVHGQRVTAVIVPRSGVPIPTLEEVRAFASDQLAAFKLPSRLFIREELPCGPTGKVLKRVLEDELAASAENQVTMEHAMKGQP